MKPPTFESRGDRELVITRVLAAPRELVWAAWTDPEHLPRWYGARGWTLPVCEVDLRPGGDYRFVQAGPDGTTMTSYGVYREVTPPERLVCTEAFEGVPGEAVNTLTFLEEGGATRLVIEVRYPSAEIREAMLETRMKDGISESFERLDTHLRAATAGPAPSEGAPA